MIIFKKIKIQNFLSYGNDDTTINLERKEPTLISGINYDASTNGELDSNGSGKSSILMAISVALYDKAIGIDNPKKNALINNINNKDMLVQIELKVGKKTYKISRYRKNKAMGGDGVKIEENNKDITPDSVANANKFIADHIMQIPFEIFGKIVAYAAGEDSFLKMPLATQRDIIEELFSYTELTNKATILKEKIKNNKTDLEYAKESNQDIKEEHQRHLRQVAEAENDHKSWSNNNNKEINDAKSEITELSKIDFEKELDAIKNIEAVEEQLRNITQDRNDIEKDIRIHKDTTTKFLNTEKDKEHQIKSAEDKLSKMEFSQDVLDNEKTRFIEIDKLYDEIDVLETTKNETNKSLSGEYSQLSQLRDEYKELKDSKCPYCHQDYEDSKKKAIEVNKSISTIEENIHEYETTLKDIDTEQRKIAKNIKTLEDEIHFKNLKEIEQYEKEKEDAEKNLEFYKTLKNPHEDKSEDVKKLEKKLSSLERKDSSALDEINVLRKNAMFNSVDAYYASKNKSDTLNERIEYLDKQTNPYDKIIKSLNDYKPKESKDGEIDQIIDDIKHQEFLLKLLTKKDSFIRKALMDKYLPFLNERLKSYLSIMGLPHKVRFTSDLSTEISQFGKEIAYSNLSSGQKARIDIALSLAFRDVLQSKHNFINLFILDECLDVGLSNVGVKKTLSVIKDVAKKNKLSMFIISHRDEIRNSFNDTLEVELRNGFSTVKNV